MFSEAFFLLSPLRPPWRGKQRFASQESSLFSADTVRSRDHLSSQLARAPLGLEPDSGKACHQLQEQIMHKHTKNNRAIETGLPGNVLSTSEVLF